MWSCSVIKKKATYQLSGENGGLTQSLHPVELWKEPTQSQSPRLERRMDAKSTPRKKLTTVDTKTATKSCARRLGPIAINVNPNMSSFRTVPEPISNPLPFIIIGLHYRNPLRDLLRLRTLFHCHTHPDWIII